MLELVVYMVIAIFIISRLYGVLGKGPNIVHVAPRNVIDNKPELDNSVDKFPQFSSIIDKIVKKDNNFSLQTFIDGAEKAFEIIMKAINNNDCKPVESLLSKDLYKKLSVELQNRAQKCEIHQSTIISIKSTEIQMLDLIKNNINITIRFISERIKLIKNTTTNEIIKGDPSTIELVEDNWSFTRNIRSSSPKWVLTAV